MLRISHIQLVQFKCYEQRSFRFQQPIVLLSGRNGIGKTSVLDAIYYLCFTKSYFATADAPLALQGAKGWRISGTFHHEEEHEVTAILRETGKKEFLCNREPYSKRTQHIGRFPCVMIAPDDIEWISGSSEIRRTYLDRMISQTNADYLQYLVHYNKTIAQRNALLKQMAEQGLSQHDLLPFYNQALQQQAHAIFDIRQAVCTELLPRIQSLYKQWSPNPEQIDINYESNLQERTMLEWLQLNLPKDLILQRTTKGIHRDDLTVRFQNMPFKQVASQGQRKALLFAIKLAERDYILEKTGIAPILLLDDLFEKLDAERMERLIDCLVATGSQLIVTDTHEGRAKKAFHAYADRCEEIIIA